MLPDPNRVPTRNLEACVGISVSSDVARDLLGPIPLVLDELTPTVRRAPVPETAVDEHGNSRSRKDEVGLTLEIRQGPPVDEVAKAEPMNLAAHRQFGFGIAAALALHPGAGPGRRREGTLRDPRWACR